MAESLTPRTDEHLAHLNLPDGRKMGIPDQTVALLRQLERELAAVTSERDAWHAKWRESVKVEAAANVECLGLHDRAESAELQLAEARERIKQLDPYGRGVVSKSEDF